MHTYYDNLQVSRTASFEVIRASYRTLIQKYHPDRFPDKERGARITQIVNAAYAILGDPDRRSAYDTFLDAESKADVRPTPSDAPPPNPERRSRAPQPPPRPKPSESMRRLDFFVGGVIAVFVVVAIAQGLRISAPKTQRGTVSTPRLEATPAVLTPAQSQADSVGVLAPAHPGGSSAGTIVYASKIPTDLKRGSKVRIVDTYAVAGSKERLALYRIEEPPVGKDPGATLVEESFKTGIYKIYSKSRRIAPLKIDMPHTDLAYFLKLMNPTTGEAIMTMMARGGEVLQVDVPLGTYRLRYAYGPVWFGEENKFGEDTRATEADADLTFSIVGDYASGHEIELVQQLNGNLRERSLDPALF